MTAGAMKVKQVENTEETPEPFQTPYTGAPMRAVVIGSVTVRRLMGGETVEFPDLGVTLIPALQWQVG